MRIRPVEVSVLIVAAAPTILAMMTTTPSVITIVASVRVSDWD